MAKASRRKKQLDRTRRKIAAQQVIATAFQRREDAAGSDHSDMPPWHDPDAPIPAEMVDTYLQVFEWAEQNPHDAAKITQLSLEHDIIMLVAGIAWADVLGFPPHECEHQANLIQHWCVLNGTMYMFEWRKPVAAMTIEEIITNCRALRDAGIIPRPRPEDV